MASSMGLTLFVAPLVIGAVFLLYTGYNLLTDPVVWLALGIAITLGIAGGG